MQKSTVLHHRCRTHILFLAIVVVTVLVYLPGLDGPFLLDDFSNTLKLKMTTLDLDRLLSLSFSIENGPLRRPITNASFALNFIFFGDNTYSFKLSNLLLHILTGAFLYLISQKLLIQIIQKKQSDFIALITVAIWLLHPLQTSTVLYVVQRMTILSSLFTLIAILFYLYSREKLLAEKTFSYLILILGYFLFWLLGLFSKETAVLLPLYVLIIETVIFKFRGTTQAAPLNKRLLISIAITSIIPIIVGIAMFIAKNDHFLAGYINREFTLGERLLTQAHVLWSYINQYFIPTLQNMSLFNDDFPITKSINVFTGIKITGLLLLAVSSLLLIKKSPIFSFGVLWFFISHSLESSIFPLELKFEHRNYLALYGLMLCVVYFVYQLAKKFHYQRYANILIISFILLMSYQSYTRNTIWSSRWDLFLYESIYHPRSYRLNNIFINADLRQGNYRSARKRTLVLKDIRPQSASIPLQHIIIDCTETSDPKKRTLINSNTHIQNAINLISTSAVSSYVPAILIKLGKLKISRQCSNISYAQLLQLYNSLLAHPITQADTLLQQKLFVQVARIHIQNNRYQKARSVLEYAYQLNPVYLNTLLEKGYIELNNADLTEAERTVKKLKEANLELIFFRQYTSQINELESYVLQERR